MKQKIKTNFKTVVGIGVILLGIISFIMASFTSNHGTFVSDKYYGGDAYTGIQNAVADTANNINSLINAVNDTYTNIMIFVGICLIISGSLCILYDILNKKKNN